MAVRARHLHDSLRGFCLGAFSVLEGEIAGGAEIPFAFEEHGALGRPSLYEYRPLVRAFVEARAPGLARREDARAAVDELLREPAAAIFARAHAGGQPSEQDALFRTVLLPLLVATAEGCGGFDWDDSAYERAYAELEHSLLGAERTYAAVAPLVGLVVGTQVELGRGIRVRLAVAGELAAHWPEATGLLPKDFGRERDQLGVIELERTLPAGEHEPPDAPGELADAISALRLATSGAISAGPVIFERLDWRPFGIKAVLPIAATQPPGESTRLDQFRGQLARDLLERLGQADDDPELAEALDRWELSLFAAEPYRSEQLRESLVALLGEGDGVWAAALRTALLLGEADGDRARLLQGLRRLARGGEADELAQGALRRALVEVLVHGDRPALVESLDEALLGLRPRPAGYFALRAATA
jgi:hypothetical protein